MVLVLMIAMCASAAAGERTHSLAAISQLEASRAIRWSLPDQSDRLLPPAKDVMAALLISAGTILPFTGTIRPPISPHHKKRLRIIPMPTRALISTRRITNLGYVN